MPFILYRWVEENKDVRSFERLKNVGLAGNGPIASV